MKTQLNSDGTFKSLPIDAQFHNVMLALATPWTNPLLLSACIQWTYNTWRASKAKRFQMPVPMEVFVYLTGESCAHVRDKLRQYGIPSQVTSIFFELWPDKKGVGLVFSFIVPAAQAAMADDILRQHDGTTYSVNSRRLGKCYSYGQPWGVMAKARSWDESITNFLFAAIYGRSSLPIDTGKGKPKKQKRDNVATERKITVRPKTKKGNR